MILPNYMIKMMASSYQAAKKCHIGIDMTTKLTRVTIATIYLVPTVSQSLSYI